MKKKMCIGFCGVILIAIVGANLSGTGWIIYHDGPYKGKVVAADTEHPIEGAAVAAMWRLKTYGGPGGPVGVYCDTQETATDKNGVFTVPLAYCFNLWPFTTMDRPEIVIFKPGYDSYPPSLPMIEQPVTRMDQEDVNRYRSKYWIRIEKEQNNTVKLKKINNNEERKWIVTHISLTDIPDSERPKKAGQTIKLVNAESQLLGLQSGWREGK